MKEYHPPMTGLEAHFEDELDPKGRSEEKQMEQSMRAKEDSKPSHENADDRAAEQAMHLGQ